MKAGMGMPDHSNRMNAPAAWGVNRFIRLAADVSALTHPRASQMIAKLSVRNHNRSDDRQRSAARPSVP